MKISIITVLNTVNYGSALQSFASKRFFEKMGHEVEFIDYWRKDQTVGAKLRSVLFDKKDTLLKWIKKPVRDPLVIVSIVKCSRVFRSFICQHISLTPHRYRSCDELSRLLPQADIYCTGSDQMWNSGWNQGVEKSFFLDFLPESAKRFSFSTSIGKTSFDLTEAETILPMLRRYDLITVRELSAVELLAHHGICSINVLDPTLLMSKSEWIALLPPSNQTKPYLLVYQLHKNHADADFDHAVRSIASQKKLDIIRIAYSYADLTPDRKIVCPDVFRFLSLLYHADFIVTDSFHGTAFSINLNRPFAVVYPSDFSTRMDSLLKMTSLSHRRFTKGADCAKMLDDVDFSAANTLLEEHRHEAVNLFHSYFKTVQKETE